MKATIDVPDALYRRVKARAALDGRAVSVGWQALGKEIQAASVDPRPLSEIIISERR